MATRVRVGVDLDGVCYDFLGAVREWIARERACSVDDLILDGSWRFYDCWGLDDAGYDASVRRGVEAGFVFGKGDPMPGAREMFAALRDADCDIRIVTARASEGHGGGFGVPAACRLSTLAWLVEHGLDADSITFDHDKTSVPCDWFIEDSTGNYDALRAAGVRCVLLNRPHHDLSDGRERVETLAEFAAMVAPVKAAA